MTDASRFLIGLRLSGWPGSQGGRRQRGRVDHSELVIYLDDAILLGVADLAPRARPSPT